MTFTIADNFERAIFSWLPGCREFSEGGRRQTHRGWEREHCHRTVTVTGQSWIIHRRI